MTTPAKHRITIPRSALIAVALLMSTSLGAPAAQAAQTKRCGTVLYQQSQQRFFNIKATGVRCATARKIIKQWRVKTLGRTIVRCKSETFCRVRNFTCRTNVQPSVDEPTDCRRPGARVTWRLGLPLGHCAYGPGGCKSSMPAGGEAFRV